MTREKAVAIVGIAILSIGVFLPIVRYTDPDETLGYFDTDAGKIPADGPGVYILIVAAVALLLVALDRVEYLWLPGVIVFWPLFLEFNSLWMMRRSLENVRLGSGWALLWGGLLLMTAPLWVSSLGQTLGKAQPVLDGPDAGDSEEEQSHEQ
jgi:hypothetical protein